MIKHDEEYYKARKPLEDLGCFQNFKRFIWDSKRKAFLGRNAKEWGKVGLFYLFFYGILFFLTWLQIWLTTRHVASHNKPLVFSSDLGTRAWYEPNLRSIFQMSSLNLHGPGIVMKPNIVPKAQPPLILLDKSQKNGKPENYISSIKKMLSEYNIDESNFDETCKENTLHDKEKPCFFDIQTLGKCSKEPYGYNWSHELCVYIKFNKRFGWRPFVYNQDLYLPHKMPKWLQTYIQESDKFHVWLSCEGRKKEDEELIGEIEYLPRPGFPVKYFPFNGQKHYQAPIVALHFKNITVNRVVNVECKTWARNIYNENRYNLNFRILINDPKKTNIKN